MYCRILIAIQHSKLSIKTIFLPILGKCFYLLTCDVISRPLLGQYALVHRPTFLGHENINFSER